MLTQGQVGSLATTQSLAAGQQPPLRQGNMGDLIVSEVHGRFYENAYRGNLYSYGSSLTALAATTTTLTNTSTPILGLWNPSTSTVNLVVLQAMLGFVLNTLTTPVGPGPFLWAASTGNASISTGNAPFNRKTLTAAGSQAKAFAGATALTGLTNNVAVFEAADLPQFSGQTAGTISASTASAAFASGGFGVQNFDGSLIVPPGGVLSLINTTSTTTYSACGRILWEEVPL